ncbi:capsule biosynthesis protein [Planktotalea sp.]|uniref:capsule biosynthesis protein n=1 Tax=Planktotalea sp. TaxID=2029877 RepID=UPI003297F0AD
MNKKLSEPETAKVVRPDEKPQARQNATKNAVKTDAKEPAKNAAQKAREERIEMVTKVEDLKKARLQKQIDLLEAENKATQAKIAAANQAAKAPAQKTPPPPAAPKAPNGPQNAGPAGGANAAPRIPPAKPATMRGRHYFILFTFMLVFVLPTAGVGWYMYERATDRYVSYMGFSVRTEETGSAFELLGGVAELSGSSSSDTDILYQFIESQQLVAAVNERLDLEKLWLHPNVEYDPVFAYEPGGTIEDITDYWNTMVDVFADSGTSLIDLQVQAFTPEDAQLIAMTIFDESLQMINRLSAIAREDGTQYARDELTQTVERLKEARTALTRFRNRTQIIDPSASITSQLGILTSLQSELAQTLIDFDLLKRTTTENDPRLKQVRQRITVIEERIAEEQTKFGQGSSATDEDDNAFADLIGEYEILAVDLEFAETSYKAAQAALDAAINESRRQSRYLAAHIQPTLPESAEKPERLLTTLFFSLFAFLAWAILLLTGYSFRDRR